MSTEIGRGGTREVALLRTTNQYRPASWSSDNAFVLGAGDLKLKPRAGQIEHSVANSSKGRSDISSKGAVLPAGAVMRRWAQPTRYTLRRNTANIMKDH